MITPEICDFMISRCISIPFFKRVNNILINTISRNFRNNTLRLNTRNFIEIKIERLHQDGKILTSSQTNQLRNFTKRLTTPGDETYTSFNQEKSFLRLTAHPEDIWQLTINWLELTREQMQNIKIFKCTILRQISMRVSEK